MQSSHRSLRRRPMARGVTLVELVVVVAIIAMLAVAFMAAYRTVRAQSVDGRATDFLDQLRRVMAVYSAQRGQYPVPSGVTNNTANTGAAAYTGLATEVRMAAADFPMSLGEVLLGPMASAHAVPSAVRVSKTSSLYSIKETSSDYSMQTMEAALAKLVRDHLLDRETARVAIRQDALRELLAT